MWSGANLAPQAVSADRQAGRTVRNGPTLLSGLGGVQASGQAAAFAGAGRGDRDNRLKPAAGAQPCGPVAASRAVRPGGWGPAALQSPFASAGQGQPRHRDTGVKPGLDASNEVALFLREIGLSQYAEALLSNGFDEMETLVHIEDSDMKELGILPCHLVKLRRRLQELQRQNAETGPALDENNPVVSFLRDIGLAQYAQTLLQSGFDELETLADIEDADMKELGIPRGHAVKLKRCLRDYQSPQVHAHGCQFAQQPGQAWCSASTQRSSMPVAAMGTGSSLDGQGEEMQSAATAVQRSWEQVQAMGTYAVGELMYRHTFELAPELIDLFPPEVRFKYRDWTEDEGTDESNVYESPALRKLFAKFLNAIGCTVAGLHDFDRLVPMLTQLGARHINYGVKEHHWPILGRALIRALRDCLGSTFTSEVEQAWTMVYGFMSNIMIQGLRSAIASSACPALSQKLPEGQKANSEASQEDDCHSDLATRAPSDGSKDAWPRQTSSLDDEQGEEALESQSTEGPDSQGNASVQDAPMATQ